jgi:hypothetical protein
MGCTHPNASLIRHRWVRRNSRVVALSFLCHLVRRTTELLRVHRLSGLEKNVEMVMLRHQLEVLPRRTPRPRFTSADRVFLALAGALLPCRLGSALRWAAPGWNRSCRSSSWASACSPQVGGHPALRSSSSAVPIAGSVATWASEVRSSQHSPTATPTSRVEALAGLFLGAYNGPSVSRGDLLAVRNVMPVFVGLAAVTAPVRATTRRRPALHRTETEHDPGR